jgi:hypothetical protein
MSINNLDPNTLAYFTGTESYTYGPFRKFVMTDGATYLCENGCAWFLDLIASHQNQKVIKASTGFQVWKLTALPNDAENMAKAVCDDGNGNVLASQLIPYTDFPFDKMADGLTVYLQLGYVPGVGDCWVAMLPSEY